MKVNWKYIVLSAIVLVKGLPGSAQLANQFWNESMQRIAQPGSRADWVQFKPGTNIDPASLFTVYKTAFGLGNDDEMKVYKIENDNLGFTHYRYNQYYKGYRIVFAEYFVHSRNNAIVSANGKMLKGLNKYPNAGLSRDVALNKAKQFFPSPRYAWEMPQLEQDKKLRDHEFTATYYPAGELVWVPSRNFSGEMNAGLYELAWSFDIVTSALHAKRIFVHASNGTIVNDFTLEYSCIGSSVLTNYNGSRSVLAKYDQIASTYLLWNDCNDRFIHTRRWQWDLANADEYTSTANNWSGVSSAATSHWAAKEAERYFDNVHGRNCWDNAGAGVNIYQDAQFCLDQPACNSTNGNNSSFFGGNMFIGNSDNGFIYDDWNTLDIVAHEFTHGVTFSSAGLVYAKESGALNESFSDIFGYNCYAAFRPPDSNMWKVGFDRKNPTNAAQSIWIRNMANPNSSNPANGSGNDPDTYMGAFWYSTTGTEGNDSWGVHTNSGVQNFMYYLLVTGGSGINDNGTPYSVTGISISDARNIAYRALTVYLGSNSQFADARNAWVAAASDLFGVCSFQAIQTGKAWFAVGLGPPNVDQYICGNYGSTSFTGESSGSYFLAPNCSVTITNTGNAVQFGGRSVIITPGFLSQTGSAFRAYVSECYFASW